MELVAGTSAYNVASVHRQMTGNQIRVKFENDTVDENFQIIEIIPVFERPQSKVAA